MREIVSPLSGFGSPFGFRRASGPQILLSASSIAENAVVGSTVGVLSVVNGTGTWTFTKTADPDSKFVLAGTGGSNLNTAAALNFETAQSHSVTIQATNGTETISRTFAIGVTNVFEQPSLNALSVPASVSRGTTINITGATSGSTITGTMPTGWTLNGAARTIAIAADAPTGSQSWSLTETLADSANSPRVSSGSSDVSAVAPLPGPIVATGTDYTYSQLITGFMGAFDYGTAGRILFPPGNNASIPGAFVADITGTAAFIRMFQNSSQPSGMVEVSVDGGAFASAGAASGGEYTLFTGLSDTPHTVLVRVNAAYGVSVHVPTTGNFLRVTGAAPAVTVPRAVQMETSGLNILESACAFANAPGNLDVNTPAGVQSPGRVAQTASPTGQRNTSSFKIRTDATEFWIYGEDNWCWINDGTTTTRYALNGAGPGALNARLTKLTGFSGLKEYAIWTEERANQVIAPYNSTFATFPAHVGRFDEYGDSICEGTAGNPAQDRGFATVFQTAVGLNRIGGNFGISGNTIANLRARIDLILANKEITSQDVAFLTIGRNNTGGAFDATETTDYQYIVSALVAAGYGRVICRGLLPEGANLWPAESGSIQSIVTGFADPKVVFMNASTFTGLSTHDGVHLTVTGFNQLRDYQLAVLPGLIGTL